MHGMRTMLAALALTCSAVLVGCTSDGESADVTTADVTTADATATGGPVTTGDTDPIEIVEHPAWASRFDAEGTVGTFVARRIGDPSWHVVDVDRAGRREIPASTFKILNSLIILETGVVDDVDDVLEWDGVNRGLDAWDRDQTMRHAIEFSAVWAYQHWARGVGLDRMRAAVDEVGYGNADIGEVVDRFWLDGPLRISAIEQVEFLERLADGELPFATDVQASVREILVRSSGLEWSWSHKTGTSLSSDPPLGWLVGLTEFDDERWAFALHLDLPPVGDVGTQLSPTVRTSIARELLVELGALPA